jgi:ABC-type dipeptide/oligopeptide/nickel transport system permease subunit
VFGWPLVAKGVRGIVASEREREYVHAARALGAGTARILLTHIAAVGRWARRAQATLLLPAFILAEATMSYIGSAFPIARPRGARCCRTPQRLDAERGPWTLAPAGAIFVVVLG